MSRLKLKNWFSSVWRNRWLVHSARTGIGAAVSLTFARLMGLPEAYWAPVTTLIVMQSTLGAAWSVSKKRFIGTALGAALGGMLASYFEPGISVFGLAICGLGLICGSLRLDQTAYRFAGITLSIVMLVVRKESPWLIGVHRFIEVSMGIAVALALTALWSEGELASGKGSREGLS